MSANTTPDFSQYNDRWLVYVIRIPVGNGKRLFCSYTNHLSERLKDHLTPKRKKGEKLTAAQMQRKTKLGSRTFAALEVVWLGACVNGVEAQRVSEMFTLLQPNQKANVIIGEYAPATSIFKRVSLSYEPA